MKYVTTERFIVSSNTTDAQKKYRDNYDSVFRQEEPKDGDIVDVYECASCGALRVVPEGVKVPGVQCDKCWDKRHEPVDEG